VTYWLKIAYFC